MGYNTSFKGKLKFKKELTIKELNKLETFLGKDCRNYPDLGNTELTYIDLELTEDKDGLTWDDSERTYDLVKKVNLIIRNMQKEFPDFGLEGELKAQGESSDDIWKLKIVDNIAIREDIVLLDKNIILEKLYQLFDEYTLHLEQFEDADEEEYNRLQGKLDGIEDCIFIIKDLNDE